ncbi:MAG TPA: hypothetical protein VGF39_16560 [Stellaceae bacterium]|jgi:hypothetical protein
MLDFPASPTPGQIFTAPNGTQWTWDSVKWTSGANVGGYLPLAGGTMSGDIVLAHDPPAALNPATKQYVDAQNIRYKNRIINGDMAVDQRHGGATSTPAVSAYAIDRWELFVTVGSKGNVGQIAALSGLFPYTSCLSWGTAAAYAVTASDYFFFVQTIEGVNFNDTQWGYGSAQPVTLEFWASSTLTGTFGGSIRNGADTRSYVFTYSLPTANTWTKVKINVPGDTAGTWSVAATAKGLDLAFSIGAGATFQTTAGAWVAGNFLTAPGAVSVVGTLNATLNITGVALMVGAAAANAEPEFKKYADNLVDCQRYYEKSYPQTSAPGAVISSGAPYVLFNLPSAIMTNGSANIQFKATKRSSPTTIVYSPTTGASGKGRDIANNAEVVANSVNVGDSGFAVYSVTSVATAQPNFSWHWTADADF